MAKYTTAVRTIVEQVTINNRDLPITKRVELACPLIFNFDYPIWAEDYKPVLEKKIIMHYFNKEIGFETVGLWRFYLEERLNLIMPYYNKLYETTVKDYDYLSNVNMSEVSDRKNDETENAQFEGSSNAALSSERTQHDNEITTFNENASGNSETNANESSDQTTHNLRSDLPQANYNDLDYGTNLDEGSQNVSKNSESTTTASNETNRNNNVESNASMTQSDTNDLTQSSTNDVQKNSLENYVSKRWGANGAFSFTDLLLQYRDSLINIDKMVIDELSDLFMYLY